jgi:hypothetical protein
MNQPGTPDNSRRHLPNSSPAHQTALRGASLAFHRTGPSPSPNKSTANASRNNGALIAATSASRDHSLSRPSSRANSYRISRQTTGSSAQDGNHGHMIEHGAVSQRLAQLQSPQHAQHQGHSSAFLLPPGRPTMADPRSPSFIAATLAASRSASPSPNHAPQTHPYTHQPASRLRRKDSVGAQSVASSVTSLDLTDTTSIAPTNALVSMFEKHDNNTDPVKNVPRLRPSTPTGVGNPASKPEASPSRLASELAWERGTPPPASTSELKRDSPRQSYREILDSKKRPPTPPPARASRTEFNTRESGQSPPAKAKPRASTPTRPISHADTVILSPQPRRAASHKMVNPINPSNREHGVSQGNQKRPPPAVKPKPRPRSMHIIPTRPAQSQDQGKAKTPVATPRRPSSTSSNDTFVSASSGPSPGHTSPQRGQSYSPVPGPPRRRQSLSGDSMPTRRNPVPPPPRRPQLSTLPLNSLTNATMAGILASSRAAPNTATPPPPLPPSRRSTPHIRQTLRQPPTKSDDEDDRTKLKHRKKPLQSKKKHAHHEGERRRWREEITARERKRYEGLWASNRGLLLTPPEPSSSSAPGAKPPNRYGSDLVANVVVREIWARSRLPLDELAEVWDLVDRQGRGFLDKTEFVVGMWLIDQRLRGRKIPQKVGDSVWGTANGVRVLGPKKKH